MTHPGTRPTTDLGGHCGHQQGYRIRESDLEEFLEAHGPKVRPHPDSVEDYLRTLGADLSALPAEDFARVLVEHAQDRVWVDLEEFRDKVRAEVEAVDKEFARDPDHPVARAARRRARGRLAHTVAAWIGRKYATGVLDEDKIAEIARELERDLIGGAA